MTRLTRKKRISGMELRRYRKLLDVIDKRLTQEQAASDLGLSTRQLRRLLKRVQQRGMEGVVHGLVGKPSNHRLSDDLERRILALWNERYRAAGLNFTHFTEKLKDREGIEVSKEKVRTLLRSQGVADRAKRRGWKHRKARPRRERFGELLQQDTSPHDWLGTGVEYHAVVIVDDATSRLLFLKLYESDGTLPNMEAMHCVFLAHGLPMAMYTDAAGWFVVTRHWQATINRQAADEYCTQIERALEELGVELIIAGSPQAKGRVERSNGTLQDRLVAELKLRGIRTLGEANAYIQSEFVADYNQRFARSAQCPESGFVPLIGKEQRLKEALCLRFKSCVQNDNTISKARRYQIQLMPTAHRMSWVKAPVEISIHLDGTTTVRHEHTRELIPHDVLRLDISREFKHPTVRRTAEDIFILPKADISI
jgi:transposase